MDEYGNMTLHEKYCSKQDFVDTTIQYYESHAEEFASNTKDVDMGSIRSRLLSYIPKGGRILDFGCGTGRDAKAFLDLGYDVTAIDGSEAMCQIAHTLTGLPIRCLDFRKYVPALDEAYDGIWACASLLHLRRDELIPVMCSLCQALQPEGAFYVSFKYGSFEGEKNGRYFTDFTLEGFSEFVTKVHELQVIEYWITMDVRNVYANERWLNILLKRTIK